MDKETKKNLSEQFNINRFHEIIPSEDSHFDMGFKHEGPNLPIVYIDFSHSPHLQRLFEKIIASINPDEAETKILEKVFTEISSHFLYTEEKEVDDRIKRDSDRFVSLDQFVEKRAGTCFQTTLTTGITLEKLNQLGLLRGKPLQHVFSGDRFSHVWCEIDISNQKYVLDIVSNFFGSKQEHDEKIISELAIYAFY